MAWSLAVVFMSGTLARAEGVVSPAKDGRLDVNAPGVAVGSVLRELLPHLPMDGLWLDPKVAGQTVTVRLANVTAPEALNAVLAESRLPYVVWGGAKGPWRVVVGDKDAAVRVGGGPAAPAETAATAGNYADEKRVEGSGPSSELMAQWQSHEDAANEQAEKDRVASEQPVHAGSESGVTGGYTQVGDSVTYNDPTFVPYKNRPEVRQRRQAIDVSTIP
jgi:hypothetical protein